ncbi:unnamed protein product [Psylliodes chrysocephalus]|uniref:Saposin B-type domain-containing protein n=1 Tax=Psylliodes chrysocephalus TaxID=3402493 RepID=A0A9P0G9G7_9CUCU|nr:unnamed protein product [Psylliodes chrysocephala]
MKCLGLWIFFLAAISLTYAANKPNCKSCLTVAEVGKDILSSGVTDDEIKGFGQYACSLVPVFVKSFCLGNVQDAHQLLYDMYFIQGKTPEQLCIDFSLC